MDGLYAEELWILHSSQSVDKVATLVKFMAYAINFNTGG